MKWLNQRNKCGRTRDPIHMLNMSSQSNMRIKSHSTIIHELWGGEGWGGGGGGGHLGRYNHVCRYFQRGNCNRGSSCRYFHHESGCGGGGGYHKRILQEPVCETTINPPDPHMTHTPQKFTPRTQGLQEKLELNLLDTHRVYTWVVVFLPTQKCVEVCVLFRLSQSQNDTHNSTHFWVWQKNYKQYTYNKRVLKCNEPLYIEDWITLTGKLKRINIINNNRELEIESLLEQVGEEVDQHSPRTDYIDPEPPYSNHSEPQLIQDKHELCKKGG